QLPGARFVRARGEGPVARERAGRTHPRAGAHDDVEDGRKRPPAVVGRPARSAQASPARGAHRRKRTVDSARAPPGAALMTTIRTTGIRRRLSVGAELQPGGGAHVRVWAPACNTVDLVTRAASERL